MTVVIEARDPQVLQRAAERIHAGRYEHTRGGAPISGAAEQLERGAFDSRRFEASCPAALERGYAAPRASSHAARALCAVGAELTVLCLAMCHHSVVASSLSRVPCPLPCL